VIGDVGLVVPEQCAVHQLELAAGGHAPVSSKARSSMRRAPPPISLRVASAGSRAGRECERVVDRRREVAVRVDQGAVEVEADDVEGERAIGEALAQASGNRNRMVASAGT
jgi:hypothetical protein